MTLHIDAYGATDVGNARARNEDQFLVADLTKAMLIRQTSLSFEDRSRLYGGSHGHLYVVADGIGGAPHGDVASKLAVQTIVHYVLAMIPWFLNTDAKPTDELEGELVRALRKAESVLRVESEANTEHQHMGTTMTMAYLLPPHVFVVHVGDSRCYLLRGTHLHQVTTDHTVAQQLVESGAWRSEQGEDSPLSSVLWQAVGGTDTGIEPEFRQAALGAGDTILLCTDGLTCEVAESEITDILVRQGSAEAKCTALIDAANRAGGSDNITVVVARLT
jgi:protein phosphatase